MKVPAVAGCVGNRPAVWVDDVITPGARAWAAREIPTLLVEVDPAVGLTRGTVDLLRRWAVDHRIS
jgi:hypothetical protein